MEWARSAEAYQGAHVALLGLSLLELVSQLNPVDRDVGQSLCLCPLIWILGCHMTVSWHLQTPFPWPFFESKNHNARSGPNTIASKLLCWHETWKSFSLSHLVNTWCVLSPQSVSFLVAHQGKNKGTLTNQSENSNLQL